MYRVYSKELHTLLLFVHDVIYMLSVNKVYNEIMYNVYTSFDIIISVSLLSTYMYHQCVRDTVVVNIAPGDGGFWLLS